MTHPLTFIGPRDPFSLGLVGEEEQPGPILAMAGARRYDRILLLATRDQGPRPEETRTPSGSDARTRRWTSSSFRWTA
jgi:hypothetical protein